MRKIKLIFGVIALVVVTAFISACEKEEKVVNVDYTGYESYQINREEIFEQEYEVYYIHLYKVDLLYCEVISSEIKKFIDDEVYPMYLLNVSLEANKGVEGYMDSLVDESDWKNVQSKTFPVVVKVENKKTTEQIIGSGNIRKKLTELRQVETSL